MNDEVVIASSSSIEVTNKNIRLLIKTGNIFHQKSSLKVIGSLTAEVVIDNDNIFEEYSTVIINLDWLSSSPLTNKSSIGTFF